MEMRDCVQYSVKVCQPLSASGKLTAPRCCLFCLPVCKVARAVGSVPQCSTMSISGGHDPFSGTSQIAGQSPLPNGRRATTWTNPYLKDTLGYVVTMPERQEYSSGLPFTSVPSVGVRC